MALHNFLSFEDRSSVCSFIIPPAPILSSNDTSLFSRLHVVSICAFFTPSECEILHALFMHYVNCIFLKSEYVNFVHNFLKTSSLLTRYSGIPQNHICVATSNLFSRRNVLRETHFQAIIILAARSMKCKMIPCNETAISPLRIHRWGTFPAFTAL